MSTIEFEKTEEPWLFVEIEKLDQLEVDSYYEKNKEFKNTGATAPYIFRVAVIKNTFDEEKYPVGSKWMIGDAPAMKVNFLGEKITMIKQLNLYGKIRSIR